MQNIYRDKVNDRWKFRKRCPTSSIPVPTVKPHPTEWSVHLPSLPDEYSALNLAIKNMLNSFLFFVQANDFCQTKSYEH